MYGEFDTIRKEWPECPDSVFIGAETGKGHICIDDGGFLIGSCKICGKLITCDGPFKK
jgi:hypothetical protein